MPAAKQMEMETMPERSPLGKACNHYLDLQEKIKDLDAEANTVVSDILLKMQDEGKSFIRFNGWEFEMDTPKVKLKIHALKGKAAPLPA